MAHHSHHGAEPVHRDPHPQKPAHCSASTLPTNPAPHSRGDERARPTPEAQGCAAAGARKHLRYKEVAPKHRLKRQPAQEGSAHRWTNAPEASAAKVTSAQGAASRTRSNGSDRDRSPTRLDWTRADDLTADLDSGPHGGEHHARSVQPAQTPPESMCLEGCHGIVGTVEVANRWPARSWARSP